jgi:FemAB-related protein (PEP-CTERM system-associated)
VVTATRSAAAPQAAAAPLQIVSDPPRVALRTYLAAHPEASGYHDPVWLDVFHRAFGHRTTYLAAEGPAGIVGVLPLVFFSSLAFGRFAVSLPFVNYGGIVADDDAAARALLDAAVAVTSWSGGRHLELRHTRRVFADLPARRHKVAMTLPLAPSSEEQWRRLDKKVRNQVRKAEKSALETEEGGAALLPGFYGVFARNMRDLGTPVYGMRFFEEVLAARPDSTRVFVVRSGGRVVAASLVYWHGDTLEVPWASALREYNPLCANMLLYWRMLRFAADGGFTTFDFGRSTPGEGTFLFKRQWGAEPHDLVWEYWLQPGAALPDVSPKNPKFSLAVKGWQHLPVPIATALGPRIVRNIP